MTSSLRNAAKWTAVYCNSPAALITYIKTKDNNNYSDDHTHLH